MLTLSMIGIGCGDPEQLTLAAVRAINAADLVLIPRKGEDKTDLAELRRDICGKVLTSAATRVVEFDLPVRDVERDDYRAGVDDWHDAVAQAFAVFLPVRSVGVMGDGRTYDHVVALRAVQTTDFMTAHWAPLPHELLATVSSRIINEVRGINRVVYDISGKPPATIEWE